MVYFKIFISLIVLVVFSYLLLLVLSVYKYNVEFGFTYSPAQAQHFGLSWRDTYIYLLDRLKPKYIRLSAIWSEIEKQPNEFNFEQLDWLMAEAKKRNIQVVLVVGQKAPRWPECFIPEWLKNKSELEYEQAVLNYLKKVINRYKNNHALEIWQVENEPFIHFKFGECKKFTNKFIDKEIKLVKDLDGQHKVLLTDSGELGLWYSAIKKSDIFGTTLYRKVRTPKGKIINYNWLPAAFYRLKLLLMSGKINNFYITELQVEPWFVDGDFINTPLEEQFTTMSFQDFKNNLLYSQKVGASRVYLWGLEWMVWLEKQHSQKEYLDYLEKNIFKPAK